MMNLPKSTEVGRIVAKERFYAKESYKIKDYFVNTIEKIIWANKISPTTLNISSKKYIELQVFEVYLKLVDKKLNDIIRLIDSKIPYLILFLIIYKSEVKAIISYKQVKEEKTVIIEQFESAWQDAGSFKLGLKGNSVDAIYESYLYQIESDLHFGDNLDENIDKYKQIKKLKAEIEKINRKIRKEPSIAKRQELARERKELEGRIEEIQTSKK